MKKAPLLTLLVGLAAFAAPATAQINWLYVTQHDQNAEGLVGGMVANTSGTYHAGGWPSLDWSSPATPATLSAGGTMTFGQNNGHAYPDLDGWCGTAYSLANVSGRGVIRGKNNNGGTASHLYVGCTSSRELKVRIWGPTLNNYGVSGATNFRWEAYTASGYSNSGTGEASFTVPVSYLQNGPVTYGMHVHVYPTNDNELGSVMVHYDIY